MTVGRVANLRIYGWVGARLAVADRGTRKALVLNAAASALICLVVAAAFGAQAVVQEDGEIQAWRKVVGDRSVRATEEPRVWLTSGTTYPTGTGEELTVLSITAPPGARLGWPGLEVFPESETVLASDAVARSGSDVRDAVELYIGSVDVPSLSDATLDDDFLRVSDELVAVRLVPASELEPPPGSKGLAVGTIREPTQTPRFVIVALLLVLFASATLLVTICARFLQHNRANLAAVRLQGVGGVGVAVISLVPIAAAALTGACAAAVLYALVTRPGADLLPRAVGFVLHRAAIPVRDVMLAVLVVVGVVVAMGLLSVALSRRSLSDVRGNERLRVPVFRALLLVPGALLIGSDTTSDRDALLWWAGVGLFLIGVLALGRVIVETVSSRRWDHPQALLGFGILRGSANETRLLYTPTVAVLFVCALMVPLSSGLQYEDELSKVAHADLIVTDPAGGIGQLDRVRADLEGSNPTWDLGMVASMSTEVASAGSPAGTFGRHTVWVGECADLALFFGESALPCDNGRAYFSTDLRPASVSQFAQANAWQRQDLRSDLIYWVNSDWNRMPEDDLALGWVAVSLNGGNAAEAISTIARRFPAMRVEIPAEYRKTQSDAGNAMRALVLTAIAVVAMTVLLTFLAATTNYLARRTVYLEHVLRLGLRRRALLVSALIAIVIPISVGGLLVLPTGIVIGSSFADGSTPVRYMLLAAATLLGAICVGVIVTSFRVIGLQIRAPERSLGGAGVATRG